MHYILARRAGGQQMFGWAETEMAANAETAWRNRLEGRMPLRSIRTLQGLQQRRRHRDGDHLDHRGTCVSPCCTTREDTATSYKLKVLTKGGKTTEPRILLKVASITTSEDAGITHPPELAGWLLEKCGARYVGAICDTQNVTVGDSAQSIAHLSVLRTGRETPPHCQGTVF
jgi:hypothetical protein